MPHLGIMAPHLGYHTTQLDLLNNIFSCLTWAYWHHTWATNTHNTLDWHHAHLGYQHTYLTHFNWHHAHVGGLPTHITHFDWHHAHVGGLPIHKTHLDLLTNIFFMPHLGIMAPHLGYHQNTFDLLTYL